MQRIEQEGEREEEKKKNTREFEQSVEKKQSMHDYPTPVSPFLYMYMEQ